ncbi:MAG: sigma-54-dependent Fis family transcriptional regulator [Bacteroidales bacterium]|nr:sigma-54-dependent Fis family transcriptional regulator [Bacteroidales bacterium]
MNPDFDTIKRRFEMIGFNKAFEHAVNVAVQAAKTDLSVLVTGESGVGKENIPKIIHAYSDRKNKNYIAVNCGAIPEGTIDSELFGHEKGAFTGALDKRSGYFEDADGGTIFLDEVADLPLATQVRLLRVLESGEYIRVGSSKVQKTNVRVVAATNVDIADRINKGKFRLDLYYRLCSVPIRMPALRERQEDILPLFVKFASDFSAKYHSPIISLTDDAKEELKRYGWPGNIRQLKNVTEQMSLIEEDRLVNAERLKPYLTSPTSNLPVLAHTETDAFEQFRWDTMKVISDLSKEIVELKKQLNKIQASNNSHTVLPDAFSDMAMSYPDKGIRMSRIEDEEVRDLPEAVDYLEVSDGGKPKQHPHEHLAPEEDDEEIIPLSEMEKRAIEKALRRHEGSRKLAAKDLDISERTLYRKIDLYGLE